MKAFFNKKNLIYFASYFIMYGIIMYFIRGTGFNASLVINAFLFSCLMTLSIYYQTNIFPYHERHYSTWRWIFALIKYITIFVVMAQGLFYFMRGVILYNDTDARANSIGAAFLITLLIFIIQRIRIYLKVRKLPGFKRED